MSDPGAQDDFQARLARARGQQAGKPARAGGSSSSSAMSLGFRIGVDVAAALIVGVGLGLFLDRWLGTSPWLLIAFFFLGAGAGVMNVYRATRGMGYAVGFRKPPPDKPSGDDPPAR